MSEERESMEPSLDPDFVDEFAQPEPPAAGSMERPRIPQAAVRRRPALFWPLMLIGTGVILLLYQFDLLRMNPWTLLWRYWPMILILVGIDILFGRRSVFGSILSVLFVFAGLTAIVTLFLGVQDGDSWASRLDRPELKRQTIEYALGSVREAQVVLDLGSWRTRVTALLDSSNLIEGDIESYGQLRFDAAAQGRRATVELSERSSSSGRWLWFDTRDPQWEIELSPDVLLDLELDCGSGPGSFDLEGLQLRNLQVEGGSGSVHLMLPAARNMQIGLDAGSGVLELVLPQRGSADVTIDSGSGSLRIELPRGMEARVELESGSGSFHPNGELRLVEGERSGDGVWETEGYGRAENRMEIRILQGSGSVTFDRGDRAE